MKQIEALESSNGIYQKLEAFIRKYYTNELIRGVLFIGLGLLYFLFTLFVEYFLCSNQWEGLFCFGLLLGRGGVVISFILFPIFKLFKFQKGNRL
jgi:uncharacterized membrane protein (DUF485 family)